MYWKKIICYCSFLCCIFFCSLQTLSAQQTKEKNKKELDDLKARQAILMIDNGKPAEAIKLLEELSQAYPEEAEYPYEIAFAYYSQKNYRQSIDILEKQVDKPGAFGKMYHLLANSYDNLQQRDKAIEYYEKGIRLFPGTGTLYLEMGNLSYVKKEYFNALWYYEKGIENDPAYPSNYYRAAKIFLNSDEKVWGMIYGEIFMNLEKNSDRTGEMAKLLYKSYRSQVNLSGPVPIVYFSKNAFIDGVKKDTANAKPPFGISVYQPMLADAFKGEKKVDMGAISRARSRFLQQYYKTNAYLDYPNVLMDYQFRVAKAGFGDAYNHWILIDPDGEEFKSWVKANAKTWEKFINWFKDNPLPVDDKYKFFRNQY